MSEENIQTNITLSQALQYVKQGFPVFPVHRIQCGTCSCHRGNTCPSPGKHPAVDGWPELATTDDHQITLWFDRVYKNYNVGLYLGNDLVCLDVDISEDKGKDGATKLEALEKHIGELHKQGNVQRTASGGKHYIYKLRQDQTLGRHVSKTPESPWFGLDILSGNSFIVVAPSTTEKGPYSWVDCESTVPSMAEIPTLPVDWFLKLQEVCSVPTTSGKDRGKVAAKAGLCTQLMNELPEMDKQLGVDDETLDKIEAALSWIPASGWEDNSSWFKILGAIKMAACDKRGLNLACEWSGATNDKGEQADEYKGDDDVAYHWSRCSDPMEAAPDDASYTSIFYYAEKFGYPKNGQAKNCSVTSDGDLITEFNVAKLDDIVTEATLPETPDLIQTGGTMVDEEFFNQYAPSSLQPPACLTDGTAMVGVLSDIQKYIESTNPSPQPVLAALAAFSTLSTLTRRSYVGCPELLGARLNVMAVAVALSGAGKDASLKGTLKILRECGLVDAIGRESKSGSGYHSQLAESPNILFTQDEIGKWWQYTQGNATHASTIKTFFLKAFTSSGDENFVGIEYAGQGKANNIEEIDYPHASLYGVTTPSSFYEALTKADVHEGLLGRMLVVESDVRPELKSKLIEDKSALDAILRYNTRMDDHIRKGNQSSIAGFGADDPVVILIKPEAHQMLSEANRKVRQGILPELDTKGLSEVYGRHGELVGKLACLMAVAKDCVNPVVTKMEVTYAIQIVDYCCAKWVSVFDRTLVDGEGPVKAKIVKFLQANPQFKMRNSKTGETSFGVMSVGRLRNRINCSKPEFDSALASLVDGDVVAKVHCVTKKGNTERVYLIASGDPEKAVDETT